jgi:hypothetical protein
MFAILIRIVGASASRLIQGANLCKVACKSLFSILVDVMPLCNNSKAIFENKFIDRCREECRWNVNKNCYGRVAIESICGRS